MKKIYKILIIVLGVFTGFSLPTACAYGSAETQYDETQDKITYDIIGTIKDSEGNIIPGIEINVNDIAEAETDENGEYNTYGGVPDGTSTLEIKAIDIDGDKNGGDFETQSKTINLRNEPYIHINSTVNFSMTKKSENK